MRRLLSFLCVALVTLTSHEQPARAIPGIGPTLIVKAKASGPPPTITSQNTDFCSAGGGVASNLILTGTHLTGATVTVGGYSATVVSNTGTTLTVTTPADTASPTDGESAVSIVRVTTSAGSTTSSIWFLPYQWTLTTSNSGYFGYGGAWSAQYCTTVGGNGTGVTDMYDQSGNGHDLLPMPTLPNGAIWHSTGGGSGGTLPYVQFTQGTGAALWNTTSIAGNTPEDTIFAARTLPWVGYSFAVLGGPIGSGTIGTVILQSNDISLTYWNGGANNNTITPSVDFWTEAYTTVSASWLTVNGGVQTTGTGIAETDTHFEVGGWQSYDQSYNWQGYIYQAFWTQVPYTTAGRVNFAAYFTWKGL